MSEANKTQVGGDHYKSDYAHWDLVQRLSLDYLIGCATKYVTRWRKKNGLEDLKKALHYLNKRSESAPLLAPNCLIPVAVKEVDAFVKANKLDAVERRFILLASVAQTSEDFDYARQALFTLMDEVERDLPVPKPVPLTEENHYTERVGDTPSCGDGSFDARMRKPPMGRWGDM